MHDSLPTLTLKKGEDRRLRAGHLWIFSNEVDTARSSLLGFTPGDPAVVLDFRGQPLGVGLVNPGTLICCRMLTRNPRQAVDGALIHARLARALTLRERLFAEPYYRLVHAEGDELPGLIVDRFGDVLSVQANTAGMDRLLPQVLEALHRLLAPRGVLLRLDTAARELEGLPRTVRSEGETPDWIEVRESGLTLTAPFAAGQKTGWYYDMREVRRRASDLAAAATGKDGGPVLDCCCYAGALGVRAAVLGAPQVLCLDASQAALDAVAENARRCGVADRVQTARGDAFDLLAGLPRRGFALASIDPPAFIKRKKDLKTGSEAYGRLNRL
ncbi:MAG: class I SAM-dependent rRNA methyltransferase, partial [Desulfovibrionaceae bacterium]